MLGISSNAGRRAFLRATEFADTRQAESFAWEIDLLVEGPVGQIALFEIAARIFHEQRVEKGWPLLPDNHLEAVEFTLDRWWHHRFGNRKPPNWGIVDD